MSELMTDGELNELLKERLLASDKADKLVDMQAEVIFAGKAAVTPPLPKEKELFSKLGAKAASKISVGWIFTSLSVAAAIIITSVAFVMNAGTEEQKKQAQNRTISTPVIQYAEPVVPSSVVTDSVTTTSAAKTNSVVSEGTEVTTPDVPMTGAKMNELNCVASPVSSSTVTPVPLINSTPISETQTATPSVNPVKSAEVKPTDVAPVAPAKSPTKGKVSSCRIWTTNDLCSTPDSLKFPYAIECDGCQYSYDCKEINSKKMTAVILRIYKKTGFTLENGFHSISLTKANGVRLEPFAISIDRYMNNVKKLGVKFKNVVDMVLLFPEVSPGDKISIDGVVEATVEE